MITPQGLHVDLRQPQPRSVTWFPMRVRIFYLILNVLISAVRRRDGSLNRSLFSFLDRRVPPSSTPGPDGVATSDHVVDRKRDLSVRHFAPVVDGCGRRRLPVVVYFHGGGFVSGSNADVAFDGFCRRLASRVGAHVVSVEYRLAPEHRCPAPYDDGADVLRWLDRGGLSPAVDASASVFLAGDSAGGNIAHHVAARAGRERYAAVRVVGLVAIQPYFGGEVETVSEATIPFVWREHLRWTWRSFLPEGATMDHEAANVFGSGSGCSGGELVGFFPETMVVVGGLDPLQDRQRWYAQGLAGAGVRVWLVEYPDAVHAFQVVQRAATEQLLRDVGEFVRRLSGEDLTT